MITTNTTRNCFTTSRLAALLLGCLFALGCHAQADRQYIRQGNKLFRQQNYAKAEVEYQKALAANQRNSQALYNLGCALQKEHRDSDAINQYEQAVKTEPNKSVRSKAYYNMGVAHQTQKDYGKAMEAYKNCMRLNYSNATDERLVEGVKRLADVIKTVVK